MGLERDTLDYAPVGEEPRGMRPLGRFCVGLMGFFLVLDGVLAVASVVAGIVGPAWFQG